jgi:hypothetical protein
MSVQVPTIRKSFKPKGNCIQHLQKISKAVLLCSWVYTILGVNSDYLLNLHQQIIFVIEKCGVFFRLTDWIISRLKPKLF